MIASLFTLLTDQLNGMIINPRKSYEAEVE